MPDDLISWPILELTFLKMSGFKQSWHINLQQSQQEQLDFPRQLPQRTYLMEDAITALHSQKANLAFFVHGHKAGVNYYMGVSLPAMGEGGKGAGESAEISYQTVKSILHSVYNGVNIHKDPFNSEQIKSLMAPLTVHTGIVTGIPSLKSTAGDTMESEQIERLTSGLQWHDFGILVLAVPIPGKFVTQEEISVVDQMQRAQENEDPDKKRRIKYYLELQDSYLKHLQLGTTIGAWQVGVYFFAPDPSVYLRLQSLIMAAYTDEMSTPTPLRTIDIPDLKPHIEQFGLLRNQRTEQGIQSLLSYRFLTPLNSRILSAYVHLPSRSL